MSKDRITTLDTPVLSRGMAEEILRDLTEAVIRQQAINAIIDSEILEIREEHSCGLSACSAIIANNTELLRQYAEDHAEFFKDRKSIEMTHGTIGFRTGMPSARTAKGWTWKKIIKHLAGKPRRIRDRFLNIKVDANKAALINDRHRPKYLASIGVEIVQEETFFIEPKLEAKPAEIKTAA